MERSLLTTPFKRSYSLPLLWGAIDSDMPYTIASRTQGSPTLDAPAEADCLSATIAAEAVLASSLPSVPRTAT